MDRGSRLTDEHGRKLDCSFTVEDIKRVLDAIPSSKALGMDGFNSYFFKEVWGTIKEDDIVKMNRNSQHVPCCLMKLDLQKAYDTVDWNFLEEVMTNLSFPTHFIQLVMTCLTTTQYSVLINGVPTELIQPTREVIQVFFFVMLEGFKLFSSTTGLQVNAANSSIYCCGISQADKETISHLSGFKFGTLPFKYLGVPISTGKLKSCECEALVEKMTLRIKIWSSRHISFAGRIQLINSVLMSICVYWAQMFIFPKAVLKKINVICRSYLWHGSYDDGRPGAVAWDKLCWPKSHGGLGFRNLLLWNQAAMGKLAWAVAKKQDNLWVRWVHAVYVKRKVWAEFTPSSTTSWVVKYICQVKHWCNLRFSA
ncbi:uncharacterized protein [Spinacia oleracea]|uniref:Reverse transcriptase domain-containing protein n=1 Tax=Spinacia oleracea TaxID=3562 RepID=A0ABM3RRP0_SPIOL|nr:uncharacterized protein LOC130471950 [Spinacia oleracea]